MNDECNIGVQCKVKKGTAIAVPSISPGTVRELLRYRSYFPPTSLVAEPPSEEVTRTLSGFALKGNLPMYLSFLVL